MFSGMAVKLDEIDLILLRELQDDADRTNVELARIVGLSPAGTLNRVRRLKESGVIRHVVAGLQQVLVRLSTRGAQRLTTLLRLEELKPTSPLPVSGPR